MAKTISHCQGKGSLTHNNRTFSAKNVDKSRTPDNIIFKQQPIAEAYDFLFGAAVQRYNDKQKRADRKIKTGYFEHVFKRAPAQTVVTAADKRKSFYEDVVQIGTMSDTGCGTPDAETAVECLKIYMDGFQKRNPNFYLFNGVLHLDEATPHLHIDYIPVGHYKQGVDTQNGEAQALKEMGYGTGKDAINRWRLSERAVLEQICREHGIEISTPEKSHGSLLVEEYKEYAKVKEQADEKRQEVQQLDAELKEKSAAVTAAETELSEKQRQIDRCAEKTTKLDSIKEIKFDKTAFGNKIKLTKEDYEKLTDLAERQIAADNHNEYLELHSARLEREHYALIDEKERLEKRLDEEKERAAEEKRGLYEQISALKKENREIRSVRGDIAIATIRSERDNYKRKLDKVLEFIKGRGLWDSLKAFYPAISAESKGQRR